MKFKFQRVSSTDQTMESFRSQINSTVLQLILFLMFLLPIAIFVLSQLNPSMLQPLKTPQLPQIINQTLLQITNETNLTLPEKKATLIEEFNKLELGYTQQDRFYIFKAAKEINKSNKKSNIGKQINKRVNKLNEPVKYQGIKEKWASKQIAFCLITFFRGHFMKNSIISSIRNLNYTNYHTQNINIDGLSQTDNLRQLFVTGQQCQPTDIVVFINSPVPQDYLTTLNTYYQKHKIWATIQKISSQPNQQFYSLSSFHVGLLKSLRYPKIRDSEKYWFLYIQDNMLITEALLFFLQICSQNLMVISKDVNLRKEDFIQEYLIDIGKEVSLVERDQYLALEDLDSLPVLQSQQSNNTQIHHQFIDLPHTNINHSLVQKQISYYFTKYPQYKSNMKCPRQYKKQQARICLLVYSYNSEVALEASTFFYSIRSQFYKNFHVIFFDDNSQDRSYRIFLDLFSANDANFTNLFIANPTHIDQLGSIKYIIENKLCLQNQILVYMRVQDFLYGNFALSHIKRQFTKMSTVSAKIQSSNRYNQTSYHYAVRINPKKILTIIKQCQKLSAEKQNSNENIQLAIFQQALLVYFSSIVINETCFIAPPKESEGEDSNIRIKFNVNLLKNPNLVVQNLNEDDLFGEKHQLEDYFIYKSALLGTRDHQQRELLQYQQFKSQQQIWQFLSSNQSAQKFSTLNFYNKMKLAFLLSLKNSSMARQAQYYYYDKIYKIGSSKKQKNICIVGSHYNLLRKNQYYTFLETIALQNYTNYRVVIIDDKSTDGSVRMIRKLVKEKYPVLESKLILLAQKKNFESLTNKYEGIKYCDTQSIVLDVDSDDALAGIQVFNLVNTIYQKYPWLWLVYFNHIKIKNHSYMAGYSQTLPYQYFQKGLYRYTEIFWTTGHLKTMRAKLILKSFPEKKEGGRGADRHILYSNLELAGANHVKYIPEYVYMYFNPPQSKCGSIHQIYGQYNFRNQAPYKNLNSLEDQSQKLDIQIPSIIKQQFNKYKQLSQNCTLEAQKKRNNRQICTSQI